MSRSLVFAMLFCIASSAPAAGLPEFPFIIVSGKAEVKVPPDEVKVTFTIIEFNPDSQQALSVVTGQGAAVLALTQEYNIPVDQIISRSIDKSIKRARNENYESMEILGYEISQDFEITIADISSYPEFTNKLLGLQNIANFRFSFDVSDRHEVLRNLVSQASADAARRADDLASGLGASLGPVFAVSEDRDIGLQLAKFGVSTEAFSSFASDRMSKAESFKLFIPKTIDIAKTVNVIFKLEH